MSSFSPSAWLEHELTILNKMLKEGLITQSEFLVKRSEAIKGPPQAGAPRAVAGGGWKYAASVRQAVRYSNFRYRAYRLAVIRGGYDESLSYSESPITSNADLAVVVFFTNDIQAQSFRADLIDLIRSYGETDDLIESLEHDPAHVCSNLTKTSNMDNAADRESFGEEVVDGPLSESSGVFHRDLTTEDIERECLCDVSCFSDRNEMPLWVHIKAKKNCRSDAEKHSTANRLVMNRALHSLFDEDLTNDGRTPAMTAYCEEGIGESTTAGYVKLKLHVVFRYQATADMYSWCLRQALQQTSAMEFTVSVEKKAEDEEEFREMLRQRHDEVVSRW